MKIYTKTGDHGETSLIGGVRVKKHCIEIDAIGEVDELNSVMGMLLAEKLSADIRAFLTGCRPRGR
jgi:cob(I)alamin adenosyltransferase